MVTGRMHYTPVSADSRRIRQCLVGRRTVSANFYPGIDVRLMGGAGFEPAASTIIRGALAADGNAPRRTRTYNPLIKRQMLSMLRCGGKERGHKELERLLAVPARRRFPDFTRISNGLPAYLCHNSATSRADLKRCPSGRVAVGSGISASPSAMNRAARLLWAMRSRELRAFPT